MRFLIPANVKDDEYLLLLLRETLLDLLLVEQFRTVLEGQRKLVFELFTVRFNF